VINPARIEAWCTSPANGSIAPIVSFYAPNKRSPINTNFIDQHRAEWRRAVAECTICFVIGVKWNPADAHVWEPLSTVTGSHLVYVNPNDDGFAAWKRQTARHNARHLPHGFDAAISEMMSEAMAPV
jgi:hypothetical protein